MASGPDESTELSMLDRNVGSVSPDPPQDISIIDCTIKVFWPFSAWVTHSYTPQKYKATLMIFLSFYN